MLGWTTALLRTIEPVFRIGPFKPSTETIGLKLAEGRADDGETYVHLYGSAGFTETLELSAVGSQAQIRARQGGLQINAPVSYLNMFAGDTLTINGYLGVTLQTSEIAEIVADELHISLPGAPYSHLDTSLLTSNRQHQLPDASGVLVLNSQVAYRRGANWENGLDAVVAADAKVVFEEVLVAGTIVDISIMTDNRVDGSCVVDIWKANDAYPTVSDTIVSGTKPTITSAREQTSYSLANLSTTDVAVGDRFGFKLDSAADLSSITVIVTIRPN